MIKGTTDDPENYVFLRWFVIHRNVQNWNNGPQNDVCICGERDIQWRREIAMWTKMKSKWRQVEGCSVQWITSFTDRRTNVGLLAYVTTEGSD